MFPLTVVGRDKKLPKATIVLIIVNILVFLWELSVDAQGEGFLKAALQNYGLEVCKIGEQAFGITTLDAFRSMFLHASVAHVFGNMWFLFLFGGLVERFLGSIKFVRCLPDMWRFGYGRARDTWQYHLHHRRHRCRHWR